VDSGYGFENKIVVECEKPKFKTHLCKENYLGEFKTEFEK
jgi:transposase-like protein